MCANDSAWCIGGLAEIFGRKPILMGSLLLFVLGSGVCGGAKNMTMLIAGRSTFVYVFILWHPHSNSGLLLKRFRGWVAGDS